MAKLSPQALGVRIGACETSIEALEAENRELKDTIDRIKEMMEDAFVKRNPHYRTKKALESVEGFLTERYG